MISKGYYKIILLFLTSCFAIIPLYDFVANGPFGWHIKQSAVTQGAFELGVLFFIFYGILKYFHRIKIWGSIAIVFLILLYLRRHNIDVPLFLTFVYINALYFLGSIFITKINISYKFSFSFLVGISLWIFFSLLLSFFNIATIQVLVVASTLLSLISLILKKHSLVNILFNKLKVIYGSNKIEYPFYSSMFVVFFLILFVQSSQNASYDEFWYSLRGAEVLNHNGSFYEPILMLQHWVSFYPKLYEMLVYPLEYFNTFTTSRMFTVFVLIFFIVAIFEFLKTKIDTKGSLLSIFVIVTIPAIANSSILAKPDLISAFIVFMGILYFLKYSETKLLSYFVFALLMFLLSLTTKLSAVPYIAVLGVVFVIYFLKNIKLVTYDLNKMHYLLYFLLIMTFLFVTYRTISIVGVPFVTLSENISMVGSIYEYLGFNYNELYDKINRPSAKDIYSLHELFMKYNFYPTETRMIFAWISNIYTIVFVLFFFHILREKPKIDITKIIIVVLITLFIFVLYILFGKKIAVGGDGNYHLIPIITTLVLISLNQKIVNYYKFLVPIVVVNIVILFITNHGWSFGTNAFDLNFSKNPFNKEVVRLAKLKSVGAEDIYAELHKEDIRKKVIGFGSEQELFLLNASYESGPHIASQRSYLFKNFEIFKDMLEKTKTTHLLYPKYIPSNKFVEFAEVLKNCQATNEFIGKAYILLSVNDSLENCIKSNYKSVNNYETIYTFRQPKNTIHKQYTEHLWMKPFQLTRDKYFPRNSLAIRKDTMIGYDRIAVENTDNLTLSLKVMKHYVFNAKNDSGVLEIKIKDELGNSINKQFKIKDSEVISIEVSLDELKGKEYSFEFQNTEWKNDLQVVLIDTKLTRKKNVHSGE